MPIPAYLQPVHSFPLFSRLADLRRQFYPTCLVQNDIVVTHDNVSYALPAIERSCWTVLAKDCSPEHNFVILRKRVEEQSVLKIFLSHKFKVELTPTDQGITVQVNGKQVAVTVTDPYEHIVNFAGRDVALFEISYNGVFYTVNALKFGVSVRTDGIGAALAVSRYYKGKTCGQCGDNNGEAVNEFRGASGCVHRSSSDFAYSYVVPDATCSAPSFESCNRSENDLI